MKTPTSLYSRLALITSVTLVVGYFVVYAAYQTFQAEEYQSGASLSSTFLGKIVSNLDEMNGRVTTLEGAIAGASVWSKVGSDINYTAGNVGIGTASPAASLDIKRTTADSQFAGWIEGSDVNNYGLGVNIANTTSTKAIADFKSGNISRLFVRADGNVGIGTSSPTEKLEVSGGVKAIGTANSFSVSNGAILDFSVASARLTSSATGLNHRNLELRALNTGIPNDGQLFLEYTGNVGIGTASPSAKLEVAGDIKVGGGIIGTNFGQAFYSVMPNDMSFAAGGSVLGSVTGPMPVGTYFYRIYGCSGQNNFTGGANGYFVFSSGGGLALMTTEYFDNTNFGGGSCGVFRTGFIQVTIPNSTVQFKIAGYSGGANIDLNPSANSVSAYINRIF